MSSSVTVRFNGGPWGGTERSVTADDAGELQAVVLDEQQRPVYKLVFTSHAMGGDGHTYENARYEWVGSEEWTMFADGSVRQDD